MLLAIAIALATLTPEPVEPRPITPVFECVDQSYEEFLVENPDADWIDYQLYRKLCGFDVTYQML